MSIRITARPEHGIRRVGVHHPAEPVVFPDEYFEPHEVVILQRDPDLVVELLDDELLTSGERHHLHLLRDSADVTGDLSSKPHAQPDAGHAPSSTSSHGPSAEQSAAEGEGREQAADASDNPDVSGAHESAAISDEDDRPAIAQAKAQSRASNKKGR